MRLRRGFALAAAAMLAVVSLPGSTTGLGEAVAKVATPGSSDYRHFSSLDKAARRFGASDAQINTVAKSVKTLGLQFAAYPTAEGNRPPNGMRPTPSPGAASTATPTKAARPFPFNTGTPLAANCSSPLLAQRRVYAQQ